MVGCCVMNNGCPGFGISEEEAINDAYVNKCRCNLDMDIDSRFKLRKQELSAWCPTSDLLHISGVGCVQVVNGMLKDLRSGRVIRLNPKGNIFYYCLHLFGRLLSYTDILCVLAKSLEDFIDKFSNDYVHVINLPVIQVVRVTEDFSPSVTYTLNNDYIIGTFRESLGIKMVDDEAYYVLHEVMNEEIRFMLPYLGYRVGCVIEEDF